MTGIDKGPADLGHCRIRWLAARPYEHIGRDSCAAVVAAGKGLGAQLLIDGQAAWSDHDLAARLHQLDMLIDIGFTGVFAWHFVAALEHKLARLRAQAFELEPRNPALKIESVVYRHLRHLSRQVTPSTP